MWPRLRKILYCKEIKEMKQSYEESKQGNKIQRKGKYIHKRKMMVIISIQLPHDKTRLWNITIFSSLILTYTEVNWLQVFQNYAFLKKFYLFIWNNLLNNLFIFPDTKDEIYALLKGEIETNIQQKKVISDMHKCYEK